MNALTITFNDNTKDIRTTDDGLVNLTDLWRAAGEPKKKDPQEWRRYAGAAFVEFAEANSGNTRFWEAKRGRAGGTFATREIAIAYAQWISPAFQMVVCKVFLAQWDSIPQAPRIEDGGLLPVLDRVDSEKFPHQKTYPLPSMHEDDSSSIHSYRIN
jgi:hypothetical protein